MIVIDCRKLDNQTKGLFNKIYMLYEYDACAESCPLPLVKLRVILKKMSNSDSCLMQIRDKGSKQDIPKLLIKQGYTFTTKQINDDVVELYIKAGK